MKIYRVINGGDAEAITLTPSELREAYLEAQKEYDLEDVRMNCGSDFYWDCHFDGIELISEEEWETIGIPKVAEEYRDAMQYSDDWWYILRDTVDNVLRSMIADKKREQEQSV